MLNIYRLAGHTVQIESIYPQTRALCFDYMVDESKADIVIHITEDDIRFERAKSEREAAIEGHALGQYEDGYLETLAVYRKIAEAFLQYDIMLMHGSVVAVDGQAYLFTAKSGTGKSTHTRLWMEQFGDRAVMINGDKPLLHIGSEGVTVYGTPWDGKEHLSNNMACPLKAVCILTRSETNYIEQVTKKDALPMLCQQSYRPGEPVALGKTLSLVDRLGDSVGLYKLGCNMNPEAALVAYEGMN